MKSLGKCDYDFQKLVMKMEAKIEHASATEDSRPFSCENCGRQFSTSAYLSQHRRIHSGVKPYVCRFCDRKFTQLSHVQQHERIHTGEKPYSCVTCMKSFTQMSNLHSHQRQHMKNKPCKCNHCFMAFDLQQDLENHIESKHTSEKYHKILICPICSKMYNSETYLTKHVERHDHSSSKSTNSSPQSEPGCKYPRLSSSAAKTEKMAPLYVRQGNDATVDTARTSAINVSSALDISKSMVTATSGLRLDVILESLASSNCPSPLVSAAASVWGHPWFPSSTNNISHSNDAITNINNHRHLVDINNSVRCNTNPNRSMCIDLMSMNKESKMSHHQSIMNGMINHNLMSSTNNHSSTITLPTLSQITEKFICSTYSDPANKAPHINTLTTAFP